MRFSIAVRITIVLPLFLAATPQRRAAAQTDAEMAPFGQALTDLGYKSHVISEPNQTNNWRYINDTMNPPDSLGHSKISENAGAVVYPSEDAAKKDWEHWRDMARSDGRNSNFESPNIDGQIAFLNSSGLPNAQAGTILMSVSGRILHGKANVVVDIQYTDALAGGDPDTAAKQANTNGRAFLKDELFRVHQKMVEDNCFGPQDMKIQLDRASGPRFSAIKVTGSGFGRGRPLDISFNGKHIFQIPRTGDDGSIPPNAWIWIPDSAPLDQDSDVVAVVMDPGMPSGDNDSFRPKSNVVKVHVSSISPNQLMANFNALCELFVTKIPANPLGYKNGSEYNIKWALGWVKDNQWCCGGYQAQVLKLLDGRRFSANPQEREILDGLDYGPIFSGLTTTPLTHCFVVVWPHGPALPPDALTLMAVSHVPGWQHDGVVFDPWRIQKPEFYLLHDGDAGWAANSDYAYRWRNSGKPSYPVPTANPEIENIYKGCYPCDGGDYYDWQNAYPKTGNNRAAVKFIEGISDPPQSFDLRCPVSVDVDDGGGHHAKLSPDGSFTSGLPQSELTSSPEKEGGFEWLGALPKGRYTLTMTGTGDGTLEVIARPLGGDMQTYPKTTLTKGKVCKLVLDDSQPAPQPLTTDKGELLKPTATPVQRTPDAGGDNGTGLAGNQPTGNGPATPGQPPAGNTGGKSGSGAITGGAGPNGGQAGGPMAAGGGPTAPGSGGAALPPQLSSGRNLHISRWQTFRRLTSFGRGEEAQFITAVKIAAGGSRIYFASQRGTFTINPDGSGLKQISSKPASLIDISADGNKLAWYESAGNGLFVANGDGSERTPLPGGFKLNALRLTADGGKLFILCPEKGGIFALPNDGSDIKRVLTTAAVSKLLNLDQNDNNWRNQLDISDDGGRVAAYFLWDVVACNGDGSQLHALTRYKSYVVDRMALSADGRVIAHMRNQDPNTAIVFQNFDGSPISQFNKRGENLSAMQISSDDQCVWVSGGVRGYAADGQSIYDAIDCGASLWNAGGLSLTADGRRGIFHIDGQLSTDQGRPSQLMVVDFNPSNLAGAPALSEINIMPRFMLADGSTMVRVTMKSSDPQPQSIGVALLRNGVRPPNLSAVWYPMKDTGTEGDETKGDGVFTTQRLSGYTYDGKPQPPGPVTLRAHVLDKAGNLTVIDLEGLEVRTP